MRSKIRTEEPSPCHGVMTEEPPHVRICYNGCMKLITVLAELKEKEADADELQNAWEDRIKSE